MDILLIAAKQISFESLNVELRALCTHVPFFYLPNRLCYYTSVELDFCGYGALAYWAPLQVSSAIITSLKFYDLNVSSLEYNDVRTKFGTSLFCLPGVRIRMHNPLVSTCKLDISVEENNFIRSLYQNNYSNYVVTCIDKEDKYQLIFKSTF